MPTDSIETKLCMIAYDAPNGALVTAQVVHVGDGERPYRAQVFVNGTPMGHSHWSSRDAATKEADGLARCYAFEVHHA